VVHQTVFAQQNLNNSIKKIKCDCTCHRPKGKPCWFLKLGIRQHDAHAIAVPKEMHSLGGILEEMHVRAVHPRGICTKVSRQLAEVLVNASKVGSGCTASHTDEPAASPDDQNDEGSMTVCVDDLADIIKGHAKQQRVTDLQQIVGIVSKASALETNGKQFLFCWSSQCFQLDINQVQVN